MASFIKFFEERVFGSLNTKPQNPHPAAQMSSKVPQEPHMWAEWEETVVPPQLSLGLGFRAALDKRGCAVTRQKKGGGAIFLF